MLLHQFTEIMWLGVIILNSWTQLKNLTRRKCHLRYSNFFFFPLLTHCPWSLSQGDKGWLSLNGIREFPAFRWLLAQGPPTARLSFREAYFQTTSAVRVPELITNNITCRDADSGTLYSLSVKATYVRLRGGSWSPDFSALETCRSAVCPSSAARSSVPRLSKCTEAGIPGLHSRLAKPCAGTFVPPLSNLVFSTLRYR